MAKHPICDDMFTKNKICNNIYKTFKGLVSRTLLLSYSIQQYSAARNTRFRPLFTGPWTTITVVGGKS